MSFMSILTKYDRVIKGLYCIYVYMFVAELCQVKILTKLVTHKEKNNSLGGDIWLV